MARILLKISGEALSGGRKDSFYDEYVMSYIAKSISSIKGKGHEIMLVVGGGNLFRGGTLSSLLDIKRGTADYIGMLSTIQNALVMRDYFVAHGIDTRVISTIKMEQVCESYVPSKISEHLLSGRVIIFAAGLGLPYFTTDTTAVQRALELNADSVVYVKNGVNGLYTGDPKTDSSATFIAQISAREVVEKNLRGLDLTAITLAKDNNLTLHVVGMENLSEALDNNIGSIITPN